MGKMNRRLVERSNLAALEFLMSKQPRGNVRVGMGNAVGTGASNIFADVKKFQTRFQDAKEKASTQHHKVISSHKRPSVWNFQYNQRWPIGLSLFTLLAP